MDKLSEEKYCVKCMKQANGYFAEYCGNTSLHGFKYVSERRSLFERTLWICMILTSMTLCFHVIHRTYTKYKMSPVIVSFATKESPIYTIPFPAVTICPMSKSRKSLFNYTDIIHKKWDNKTLDENSEKLGQYMSLLCDEIGEFSKLFNGTDTFTDDFFVEIDKLRCPLDLLFSYCWFPHDYVRCTELFTPIITDEGVCFTFNMLDRDDIYRESVVHFSDFHRQRNSSWNIETGYSEGVFAYPFRAFDSGSISSLEITVAQRRDDIDYICVEDTQGYSVLLHPPYTVPLLKKQFFQLPLRNLVVAVVRPNMMSASEEVKKYGPHIRNCFLQSEKRLQFFKIYSPENCRLECLTNFTRKQCGCVNFYMPRENSTSICGYQKLSCLRQAYLELMENEVYTQIEIEHDFVCDCKPLCTDLSYAIEQSQSEWNYKEQFQVRRLTDLQDMEKEYKFSKLLVFFKSDSFLTLQRNELYGPIDFLANFGGLMGLFTGFSLLSLAEIIYFLTIRIGCNFRIFKNWVGNVN